MVDSQDALYVQRQYETAQALHRQGRLEEAERQYRDMLERYGEHAGALLRLGQICALRGKLEATVAVFKRAAAAAPQSADAYCNLGISLNALARPGEALVAFDRALSIDPGHAHAQSGRGSAMLNLGRLDEARAAFERAVALMPAKPVFHYNLAESKRFREGDPQIKELEALARDKTSFAPGERIYLHFALAKAYDDLKRYRPAFAHLKQGNALKRASLVYDETQAFDMLAGIAAMFTPETMAARAGSGNSSEVPIFIVGMPRSGTTLVEQMLASHPSVFGAGELNALTESIAPGGSTAPFALDVAKLSGDAIRRIGDRYLEKILPLAPNALRIVDKMPGNFFHAGLIHLALPKARIIHMRRDPTDTCFSCFSKLFTKGHVYIYELGELGRYYRAYATLMAHWRAVLPASAMLEVEYETLVSDFEREARRIVAFCGLEWDARCLDFHKTERNVRTMSAFQVRRPVYVSSVGRWRPYAEWLGPLIDALG